jgi:acyl-coenzyme A thioesterase PaaI-like protein
MPESLTTRLARWGFNWLPAYRGTGSRIEYIADDWMEVRIRLPLNWRTRNYVGTIFGGSIYGAVDPVYMVMLIKILGRRYEVWDKAATIRFRRPGRAVLRAVFRLDRGEIEATRAEVDASGKTDRRHFIELINEAGEVCATCEKIVHVRLRTDALGASATNK